MVRMTECEFNAALKAAPIDALYIADGQEVTADDGSIKWAITEERIERPNGQVVAKLLRALPLVVDSGCLYRPSGLLGGRISDSDARPQ